MAGKSLGALSLAFRLALAVAGMSVLCSEAVAEPPDGIRTAVLAPDTGDAAGSVPEPRSARAEAIATSQRCFAKLGYYKGPIDGKATADTWTAYWHFKNDHSLKGYSDFLGKTVQQKLAELCKSPAEAAALPPAPPPEEVTSPDAGGQAATSDHEDDEALAQPRERLDMDCLPEDLIAFLPEGRKATARRCERSCLPAPKGFSQTLLDELQARDGVAWCRACVPIDGRLSLEDVRRIEQAGGIQICATPQRQFHRSASAADKAAYTKIRELYRSLPQVKEDGTTIAVVIGNSAYTKLPRSEASANDADAFSAFLTEHLGYFADNVIDLRNAKQADFNRVFGAGPGSVGDLAWLVRAHPGVKVLVYYSGLGATESDQSETYLLPVDSEPYREARNGYKLSTLYANLAALNAKSVLVLLETEFSRDHGPTFLPPNLPEMAKTALPPSPVPELTVLAASDRGQHNLIDPTYDIGLFTRYLIEGLAGAADLAPVGNGNGKIDSAELHVYTAAMVRLAARKSFGLLQNPAYSSTVPALVASVAGESGEPKTPLLPDAAFIQATKPDNDAFAPRY